MLILYQFGYTEVLTFGQAVEMNQRAIIDTAQKAITKFHENGFASPVEFSRAYNCVVRVTENADPGVCCLYRALLIYDLVSFQYSSFHVSCH